MPESLPQREWKFCHSLNAIIEHEALISCDFIFLSNISQEPIFQSNLQLSCQ